MGREKCMGFSGAYVYFTILLNMPVKRLIEPLIWFTFLSLPLDAVTLLIT